MKIGVFGGRFDPIHLGHLIVAQDVLEALALDQILFLVSYHPPHKSAVAPFEDRYQMVQQAIQGISTFQVTDIEKEVNLKKSYTSEILPYLRDRGTLFFLMGQDQYRTFPQWHHPERILALAKVVVLERPGFLREHGPFDNQVLFVPVRQIQISASEIRHRIQKGRPFRLFVPEPVANYIETHGLYKTP